MLGNDVKTISEYGKHRVKNKSLPKFTFTFEFRVRGAIIIGMKNLYRKTTLLLTALCAAIVGGSGYLSYSRRNQALPPEKAPVVVPQPKKVLLNVFVHDSFGTTL